MTSPRPAVAASRDGRVALCALPLPAAAQRIVISYAPVLSRRRSPSRGISHRQHGVAAAGPRRIDRCSRPTGTSSSPAVAPAADLPDRGTPSPTPRSGADGVYADVAHPRATAVSGSSPRSGHRPRCGADRRRRTHGLRGLRARHGPAPGCLDRRPASAGGLRVRGWSCCGPCRARRSDVWSPQGRSGARSRRIPTDPARWSYAAPTPRPATSPWSIR